MWGFYLEGVWLWRISGVTLRRWWGWLWRSLHVEYKITRKTKIILPLSFSFFRYPLVMHSKRTNKNEVYWGNLFFWKVYHIFLYHKLFRYYFSFDMFRIFNKKMGFPYWLVRRTKTISSFGIFFKKVGMEWHGK